MRRFVFAQQPVYATVLAELKAGAKKTHWMWFVFPQAEGLGNSAMARSYAIRSMDEALSYLAHPLLGTRLVECTRTMMCATGSARTILRSPDDLKFRSSMTLFDAADSNSVFEEALNRFFNGVRDPLTIAIVEDWRNDRDRP